MFDGERKSFCVCLKEKDDPSLYVSMCVYLMEKRRSVCVSEGEHNSDEIDLKNGGFLFEGEKTILLYITDRLWMRTPCV